MNNGVNPLLHQHHPSQAQPQPAHIRIYTCFKKKLMFFNYMFYMFSSCFNFLHRAMVAWLHLSKPCSSLRKNQDRFATHPTRICNLSASAFLSRLALPSRVGPTTAPGTAQTRSRCPLRCAHWRSSPPPLLCSHTGCLHLSDLCSNSTPGRCSP